MLLTQAGGLAAGVAVEYAEDGSTVICVEDDAVLLAASVRASDADDVGGFGLCF